MLPLPFSRGLALGFLATNRVMVQIATLLGRELRMSCVEGSVAVPAGWSWCGEDQS